MKKMLILAILVLQFAAGISFAQEEEMNTPYSPTKREWLSIQLNQEYAKVCLRESKQCDIDFTILENFVDVYVNCGKKTTPQKEKMLQDAVNEASRKILDKYEWSKDFLVRVKISRD